MTASSDEICCRTRMLRDIEAIERPKHSVVHSVATATIRRLSQLAIENVTTGGVAGVDRTELDSRKQFLAMVTDSVDAGSASRHHRGLEVPNDTEATGTWYLHGFILNLRKMLQAQGTALYRNQYVKSNGCCKLQHQSFERVSEIVNPIPERPNRQAHCLATHGC
ncbi:MAG TPA: nuclear transport factor 2 family protein [Steroidobacteraceae bacterium]|nr:nuclear transport factor 2 family protein [Steroidobacteraceae bacterium]